MSKIEFCLVNPPSISKIKYIRERADYFCEMFETFDMSNSRKKGYKWWIVPRNGKKILVSDLYYNKAQCRNIGKRFADMIGLEWRE